MSLIIKHTLLRIAYRACVIWPLRNFAYSSPATPDPLLFLENAVLRAPSWLSW